MSERPQRSTNALTALLSAAFLMTGVATALLGATLPAILAEWKLSDRSGGGLLFSSFAGATLGALLVGRFPRAAAAVGMGITGSAAMALGCLRGGPRAPAFFGYGLGLGITMTAISVLRSRTAAPGENSLVLNRLNLLWAAGACCAPALALRSLHVLAVRSLFRVEGGTFLLVPVGLGAMLAGRGRAQGQGRDGKRGEERDERQGEGGIALPRSAPLAPWRMCLFAAAAVGLESAIGSWLTTYTQREAHGTGIAVWSNTAFWVGLLLSRGAHSVRLRWRLTSPTGVTGHLAAVTAATAALILAPAPALLPAAALVAGIGLGPLYPLVLSLALPHYRSGAVFVLAGSGASLVPWLTGLLSSSCHSLRLGLLAPCGAVVALLGCALFLRQEIAGTEQVAA